MKGVCTMRRFRNGFSLVLACAIIVVLAIFALENLMTMRFQLVGHHFSTNLGWIIASSAVLGALITFALLAPGRVAAGWRNHTLGRAGDRREQDVHAQHEQYQQLVAQHAVLQAQHGQAQSDYRLVQSERDDLRARLASMSAAQNSSQAPDPEAQAIAPAAEPSLR